jgi:hypothetical protein
MYFLFFEILLKYLFLFSMFKLLDLLKNDIEISNYPLLMKVSPTIGYKILFLKIRKLNLLLT